MTKTEISHIKPVERSTVKLKHEVACYDTADETRVGDSRSNTLFGDHSAANRRDLGEHWL